MACLGLPFCPAYNFVRREYEQDLIALIGQPGQQEALMTRFITTTSLLNQLRSSLLSKTVIEKDLTCVINKLDSVYQLCQSPEVILVSQRCHTFFFNYLESLLYCFLIAKKIQSSEDPVDITFDICLLDERFKGHAFTDLCGILQVMNSWISIPEQHTPPTSCRGGRGLL